MNKYELFYEMCGERLGVGSLAVKTLHLAGLITQSAVNMFLLLNLYPEIKEGRTKQEAVKELAERTELTERYCHGVISNYAQYMAEWRFDLAKKAEALPTVKAKKPKSPKTKIVQENINPIDN